MENPALIAVLKEISEELSRIAYALEVQQTQKRVKITEVEHDLPEPERIKEMLRTKVFAKPEYTLDELFGLMGIKGANRSQKLGMSQMLAQCGFTARRTAQARLYVVPKQ